jgi:hypothetical protein
LLKGAALARECPRISPEPIMSTPDLRRVSVLRVSAILTLGASLGLAVACASPSPTTGDPGWGNNPMPSASSGKNDNPPPPPPASTDDGDASPPPPPTSTSQNDAGPPPASDAGPPQAACGAAQKVCGNTCESIDDPAFGCLDPSCAACNPPNAIPSCDQGSCVIQNCKTGWADCNGDPSDGCEADLVSNDNCGFCGNTCGEGPNAFLAACIKVPILGPKCIQSCNPGWSDCGDGSCDVNIENDPNNCGGCGVVCDSGSCVDDACQ